MVVYPGVGATPFQDNFFRRLHMVATSRERFIQGKDKQGQFLSVYDWIVPRCISLLATQSVVTVVDRFLTVCVSHIARL